MINELITIINKLYIILSKIIKEFILFNELFFNIIDESNNEESDNEYCNNEESDNEESDNEELDNEESDNEESDNEESDNEESDNEESDNEESDNEESYNSDDESDNSDEESDNDSDNDSNNNSDNHSNSDTISESGSYNNIDNETYINQELYINKELDNDIIYIDCVNNYIKNKIKYNNYADFSFIQWNGLHFIKICELQHTLNNIHVKNIIKNMERNYKNTKNFIFYEPIHFACENNNYYMIDGYHRLKAYKTLFNKNIYPIQNVPCIIWHTTTKYNKEYIYDIIHQRITYYV